MSTLSVGQFLRLIWPKQGFYCIAHPFTLPDGGTTYYHKVFPTISEAVTHCHEQQHNIDTFFGVLSLIEAEVINYEKLDYKTQQPGKRETRVARNILAAKSVFWDLDVGADAGKYDTRDDALRSLAEFITTTGFPMPTLVSSGGGVHVYWPFVEDVPAAEWRVIAWHLRQLGEGLKVKLDPQRTIDIASVLRVPHSFNWKNRNEPRPVKVLGDGDGEVPVGQFRQLLQNAMIRAGIAPTDPPERHVTATKVVDNHGLGEQVINDFGPKQTLSEVAAACGQVREIIRSYGDPTHPHYHGLDNNAWYRGMISTVRHLEDGEDWCRKLTAMDPRSVSDVDTKLAQSSGYGPAKCTTLQTTMPWKDSPCQTCRFRNDPSVPNPLVAARKTTKAPPPSAAASSPTASGATSADPAVSGALAPPLALQLPTMSPVLMAAQIPNPPKPYERLKAGGIAITKTDKDGNETTSIIYPNDLYPLKRLVNPADNTEQQVWHVTLPRTGGKEFTIDADVLYDSRKFCVAIANNGIYPHKAEIPALQDYMVAYISQLQKTLDGELQTDHLGWSDGYRQFVLPDKTLLEDGTAKMSSLTTGAQRAAQFIQKRGTLQEQVRLLSFYNHPEYIPNQLVILGSIASPIYYATGHHGIVVNCSGDAGASKSTTLYAAAGLWGDPALWPINGTNRGATANARAQRIATNANLPTCVDEITHLPVKDAIDLVMNITQPGHRLRLHADGTERKQSDNYKSAIMIATANSSLHDLLSTDNAAGTAGSMRVFEMKFVAQRVHSKAEADEFLRQLKLNYGHIGEQIMQVVVRHRVAVEKRVQDLVREIDRRAGIQSSERFWSAYIASAIVAGEIAHALGLLPYDTEALLEWAVTVQIPFMRGVVKDEYRDPLAIMTDYIAEKHSNIVVVDRTTTIGSNTSGQHVAGDSAFAANRPSGALLGHYDIKAGVLYLLKHAFKDHCSRVGASSTRILDDLAQMRQTSPTTAARIVVDKAVRRTLGAGTDLAKGQSWCFAIDMKHPDISGVVNLTTVQGGQATTPPAGQLKAVQ